MCQELDCSRAGRVQEEHTSLKMGKARALSVQQILILRVLRRHKNLNVNVSKR